MSEPLTLGVELLAEISAAGARVEVVDGWPRLRGARLPDALLARVKAGREAVLLAARAEAERARDRWGQAPPADWPVQPLPELTPDQRQAVLGYVLRQVSSQSKELAEPLRRWVVLRRDDEALSCLEVLMWQRADSAAEALNWLRCLSPGSDTSPTT
jgi:hypothetical protein